MPNQYCLPLSELGLDFCGMWAVSQLLPVQKANTELHAEERSELWMDWKEIARFHLLVDGCVFIVLLQSCCVWVCWCCAGVCVCPCVWVWTGNYLLIHHCLSSRGRRPSIFPAFHSQGWHPRCLYDLMFLSAACTQALDVYLQFCQDV